MNERGVIIGHNGSIHGQGLGSCVVLFLFSMAVRVVFIASQNFLCGFSKTVPTVASARSCFVCRTTGRRIFFFEPAMALDQ